MNYTVTLTETEKLAMEYIAYEPQDWVENAMKERARIAIDEIVKIAVDKFFEINESIPGSKDEIVSQAYSRGWINTVKYNEDNRVPLT
jgi:glycine cleavage system H lipoate-binding protein